MEFRSRLVTAQVQAACRPFFCKNKIGNSWLTNAAFHGILIDVDGALAQLVAHNTGSVGVRSSNLLCSTILNQRRTLLHFCKWRLWLFFCPLSIAISFIFSTIIYISEICNIADFTFSFLSGTPNGHAAFLFFFLFIFPISAIFRFPPTDPTPQMNEIIKKNIITSPPVGRSEPQRVRISPRSTYPRVHGAYANKETP